MKRSAPIMVCAIATTLFLTGMVPLTLREPFSPPFSQAQEGWRTEYESVCSKTDIAMTLSVEDLKGLIARCNRLKLQIEAEEESTRKVYLRRLKMCQDLYDYVLENKARE